MHTCALRRDASVACWGNNDAGQLGDGTNTGSSTPVPAWSGPAIEVETGSNHTCALASGGEVLCWGDNAYGQLGDGTTTPSSTPLLIGVAFTDLALGSHHSCAISSASGVLCWGRNDAGQLGDGTTTNRSTPVVVAGLPAGPAALEAGETHTCARYVGGDVWCWGANAQGGLGDGTTTASSVPVPASALGIAIGEVTAGGGFGCSRSLGGVVECWGTNAQHQLGNGSTTSSADPVPVTGLQGGVSAIAGGWHHSCARGGDHGLHCWGGDNAYGQLGDGSVNPTPVPVQVADLSSGVAAISSGGSYTCMLSTSGGVWCWGGNGLGQLGDGTTTDRFTPVPVVNAASGFSGISAGSAHTCAVTGGGDVWCWGFNAYGQLGDGTTLSSSVAVQSVVLASFTAVAAGGSHTCGVSTLGGAWCWGDNAEGQLGLGTPGGSNLNGLVFGLASGVSAVEVGIDHSCALVGGEVRCWGANTEGQLGDGTTTDRSEPVSVTGLPGDVVAITARLYQSCALDGIGDVWCWGNGTLAPVKLLSGAVSISGTCAIGGDGEAYCWDPSSPPSLVTGLAGPAVAVTGGQSHACALLADGIQCWGDNAYGQLGDGRIEQSSVPLPVLGLQYPSSLGVQVPGPGLRMLLLLAAALLFGGYRRLRGR